MVLVLEKKHWDSDDTQAKMRALNRILERALGPKWIQGLRVGLGVRVVGVSVGAGVGVGAGVRVPSC